MIKKMLTPTSINGLIRCLRMIIEKGDERSLDNYTKCLSGFADFEFEGFKSSHWNTMGIALYEQFFEKEKAL